MNKKTSRPNVVALFHNQNSTLNVMCTVYDTYTNNELMNRTQLSPSSSNEWKKRQPNNKQSAYTTTNARFKWANAPSITYLCFFDHQAMQFAVHFEINSNKKSDGKRTTHTHIHTRNVEKNPIKLVGLNPRIWWTTVRSGNQQPNAEYTFSLHRISIQNSRKK